jgi:hypothetical protein
MKFPRIVRAIVHDAFGGRRRTRDARLEALHPAGKCIALGTVWTGQLKPLLDYRLDALQPLVTGFTMGRVLNAEQLANVIDLGRVYLSDLTSRIRAAAADSRSAPGNRVDLAPVLTEADRLEVLLGSAAPSAGAIGDALTRLRRAADGVCTTPRVTDAVNPLTRFVTLSPEQRNSGPNSPANSRARQFWQEQQQPASLRQIGDTTSTTAVRDGLHAVNSARSTREQNERANDLARAFWSRA